MPDVTSLMSVAKAAQLTVQSGKGNLKATGKSIEQLFAQDRAQTQVKIGSCTGNGSSLNVTVQSGWAPNAVLLFRALGSQVHIGHAAIGDGKSLYIRGNASAPQSMGVLASLGIYLQSNGFSLGSTLAVSGKSYGYIAFRSAPTQAT